jgi:hypothetical protein
MTPPNDMLMHGHFVVRGLRARESLLHIDSRIPDENALEQRQRIERLLWIGRRSNHERRHENCPGDNADRSPHTGSPSLWCATSIIGQNLCKKTQACRAQPAESLTKTAVCCFSNDARTLLCKVQHVLRAVVTFTNTQSGRSGTCTRAFTQRRMRVDVIGLAGCVRVVHFE